MPAVRRPRCAASASSQRPPEMVSYHRHQLNITALLPIHPPFLAKKAALYTPAAMAAILECHHLAKRADAMLVNLDRHRHKFKLPPSWVLYRTPGECGIIDIMMYVIDKVFPSSLLTLLFVTVRGAEHSSRMRLRGQWGASSTLCAAAVRRSATSPRSTIAGIGGGKGTLKLVRHEPYPLSACNLWANRFPRRSARLWRGRHRYITFANTSQQAEISGRPGIRRSHLPRLRWLRHGASCPISCRLRWRFSGFSGGFALHAPCAAHLPTFRVSRLHTV